MESDALAPPPIRSSMIESERLGAPSLPGSAVDSLRASLPSTRIVFAPVSGYGPSLSCGPTASARSPRWICAETMKSTAESSTQPATASSTQRRTRPGVIRRRRLGAGCGAGLRRAAERGQLREARAAAARAVDLVVRAVARLPLIGVLAQLVEA